MKKNKLYAIADLDGAFIKKIRVNSHSEVQKYIDKMHLKGISLSAWELSTSKRRLSKKLLSELESLISNNSHKLNKTDLLAFKKLLDKLKKYPAADGMIVVNQYFDTFLRELIPSKIWVAMGGTINK
ncbi:hypothetical protein [Aquimarina sp. RZ0]|uniref:hypothetical protein n=1 Tax=Aquimarina sp. RZ0 TaxID=2607730 RepID=UPI0011F1AFB5|nr:hypothetical protein [Aquimarina sp. RZ0]KAA1244539.1 hypothetical protein F0000_16265 [Aquimarina sp. RZ0]